MTAEKFVLLVFCIAFFVLCISVYTKSAGHQKKYIFSLIFGSAFLGILSLGAVLLLELLCGNLINLNFSTISAAALGSLPAVATMLFLNII